jgi:hypothetical protein
MKDEVDTTLKFSCSVAESRLLVVARSLSRLSTITSTTRSSVPNLGRRELCHGLGTLTHSMLGELTGEHKTNRRLNFPRRKRSLLIVSRQLASLASNTFKDVVDEGVHDGHSLLGDSGVGVDLLEHLVDVGRVTLDTLLGALLFVAGGGFLGCLGRCLLGGCLGHDFDAGVELVEL